MKIRKLVSTIVLGAVVSLSTACAATTDAATSAGTSTSATAADTTQSTAGIGDSGTATVDDTSAAVSSSSTAAGGSTRNGPPQGGNQGGGPGGVDISSVTTEDQLIELIQNAYGDAALDRHRGHQPVQDVLNEVLAISHDELHVRMDAGQNLAAVAVDLGLDPQTLVDALVESWSPAIDAVLASGEITAEDAERYRAALQEAFSFRVNWDGEEATPTFSGLDA